ncbi:MAG: hypothetical protein IH998_18345, partial [Proteobacteria bacterium]|nr:hypothetical protein [Pseudomonadota bacterium]
MDSAGNELERLRAEAEKWSTRDSPDFNKAIALLKDARKTEAFRILPREDKRRAILDDGPLQKARREY